MIFEIRKLLRRKELWIVAGLILLAAVLLSFRNYHSDRELAAVTRRKITAYYNMHYSDAIPVIRRELEQLGPKSSQVSSPHFNEFNSLQSLLVCAESIQAHETNMTELILRMDYEIANASDSFTERDLKKAKKMYNRAFHYHVCNQGDLMFLFMNLESGEYFEWLYLLLLCSLLSPLFAAEHENGMYQMLFSSKSGKSGLFCKKICGGLACVFLFAVLYSAAVLAILWIRYGLSPLLLTVPLQTIEQYRNCPYQISILCFALLYILMRTLLGAVVLSLTAVLSCFLHKTLAVFGGLAAFLALMMFPATIFSNDPAKMRVLQRIGFTRLFYLREYIQQYNTVNVCGYPVEQLLLAAICTVCCCLFLMTAAYLLYTTKKHKRKKQVIKCSDSKN